MCLKIKINVKKKYGDLHLAFGVFSPFLVLCVMTLVKCCQVVDETDRMLRESYQDWLPNVLKLTVTRW